MKRVTLLATVAGLMFASLGSAPRWPTPLMRDDAAILVDFEEMVSADISCAQLAAEKGHSKDVRDFAAILVREHGTARQMARDAASQIGVKPKWSTDGSRRAEHDKIVRSLRDRPDAAFDILFLRHEAEYHKELLDLIKKQWIPTAKNEDLGGFLGQVTPSFEAHSRMADELWKRIAPPR